MLKNNVLDKIGTLLLAIAIWYVVRQRTESHQSAHPATFHHSPAAH